MAISSYVNNEITSSTDTFNVWLTRTNSIITDMGSVVVSVGDNNVGDVTVTGALGANTVFAGTELRGGDANTSANLTITSAAEFDSDVTISGEVLLNGASANLTITNLNTIVNSNTTTFTDYVKFESDMILPDQSDTTTLSPGNFRFNTSTGRFEGYTGSTWELKADTALALTNARTIALSGDLAGSASFNGTSDITITTTIQNTAQTQETIADVIGTMVSNNTESGITVTYQDADNTLDFAVVPGSVDHDSLLNFVANEHIDHSTVEIIAGNGLTIPSGTPTIDSDVTIQIVAGAGLVANSSGVHVDTSSNNNTDHSDVEIIAGNGLTGGGDITTSRTLSIVAGDGLVANSSGVFFDTTANVSFDTINASDFYVDSLYANGATGTAGEFLATNGTTVYWASVSEFTGESDTLDDVTGRGATTTNAITVGGLTITGAGNIPTLSLNGDVTGSATFDGSNTSITTTVGALSDKVDTTTQVIAGSGLTGGGALSQNRTLNVGAGTGVTVAADTVSIGQDVATSANVTFASMISTGLVEGNYYFENASQISGTNITIDETDGNVFYLSTTGNTSFTFPTPTSAYSFTLEITAGGTHSLIWPAAVKWKGGITPDAPASGDTNVYVFITRDGGTTWYGFLAGEAMA